MSRVAEVNRTLKARGVAERLRRGAGYYYFTGGRAASWPQSGVYIYRAADLTLAQWLAEYDRLAGERSPATPRYVVRTVTSQIRTIREPYQIVDTVTSTVVDEYHSKRAAAMHARELNNAVGRQ